MRQLVTFSLIALLSGCAAHRNLQWTAADSIMAQEYNQTPDSQTLCATKNHLCPEMVGTTMPRPGPFMPL